MSRRFLRYLNLWRGRVAPLTLYPFSASELKGRVSNFIEAITATTLLETKVIDWDDAKLVDRLTVGGYPEVIARSASRRRSAWFEAYIETIVQRDINIIREIEALEDLPQLLELMASRVGNLLNYAEISRSLKHSASSTKRYIHLLRATFLVDLIPAWSNNATVRLRRSPKLYLNDSGLANELRGGELNRETLLRDGAILENSVANELRKLISWSGQRLRLSYYREERSYEVDFVLQRGQELTVGIEVKASKTLSASDAKGLLRLASLSQTKRFRGILLYGGRKVLPFGRDIFAVPIGALWQGL